MSKIKIYIRTRIDNNSLSINQNDEHLNLFLIILLIKIVLFFKYIKIKSNFA